MKLRDNSREPNFVTIVARVKPRAELHSAKKIEEWMCLHRLHTFHSCVLRSRKERDGLVTILDLTKTG